MKEDDLKTSSLSIDDLNSKTTKEIIDGLVKQAKDDKELALKNLENYMQVNDGFNRNVILAHQELKKVVENMKNSKFNKMIEESLDNFLEDENIPQSREDQIHEITEKFGCDYTCAYMADRYADMVSEIKQANAYAQEKINELNITEEEFNKGLEDYYNSCKARDTACVYDTKELVFSK